MPGFSPPSTVSCVYVVIVHSAHRTLAGRGTLYLVFFFRVSGGSSGCWDGADAGGLDDTSATPMTAAAALGRPRRSMEAATCCCTG